MPMTSMFYQSIHLLIGIVLIILAMFQLNPAMLETQNTEQFRVMMTVVFFVIGAFLILFYLSHWVGEHNSQFGLWWMFHILMGLYLVYYGYVLMYAPSGHPTLVFLTYGVIFIGVLSLLYSFMIPTTTKLEMKPRPRRIAPPAVRRCPADVGEDVEVAIEEKGLQVEVPIDDAGVEQVGDIVEVKVDSEVGQPVQLSVDADKVVSGTVVEGKKVQGEVVQDAMGQKKVVGIVVQEAKVQGKVEPKVQEVPVVGKVTGKIAATGVDEKTGENVVIIEGLDGTTTVKTVPQGGDCTCFI